MYTKRNEKRIKIFPYKNELSIKGRNNVGHEAMKTPHITENRLPPENKQSNCMLPTRDSVALRAQIGHN